MHACTCTLQSVRAGNLTVHSQHVQGKRKVHKHMDTPPEYECPKCQCANLGLSAQCPKAMPVLKKPASKRPAAAPKMQRPAAASRPADATRPPSPRPSPEAAQRPGHVTCIYVVVPSSPASSPGPAPNTPSPRSPSSTTHPSNLGNLVHVPDNLNGQPCPVTWLHLPKQARDVLQIMDDPYNASPEEVYEFLERFESTSVATLQEIMRHFGRPNLFTP